VHFSSNIHHAARDCQQGVLCILGCSMKEVCKSAVSKIQYVYLITTRRRIKKTGSTS
jgi:hypothetical protein